MSEELDLKEILKFIYQRKKILVYIVMVSLLIGIFYTFIIKRPTYEIRAKVLIDKTDTSIGSFLLSKNVLNGENINAEYDKNTKIISISVLSSKKDLEQSLYKVNRYMENLKIKLEETYDIGKFKIIETPQIPQQATNISYVKDIGICLVAGIVIYIAYIVIIMSLRGIISTDEIERNLNIKLLGTINLEKKKEDSYIVKNKEILEQLKRIEANIELNKDNKRPKTILLTGTKRGVGTSYITKNLAEQYTKLYKKVLIIDTDLVKETLTKEFLVNEQKGLTDIINTNKINEIEKVITKINNENMFILPKGKENIGEEQFLKETICTILEKLKQDYDVILIDSLSINNHILPIALTSIVDATVIVIEKEKTKQEDILKAKKAIENVGGKISGIILNKMV